MHPTGKEDDRDGSRVTSEWPVTFLQGGKGKKAPEAKVTHVLCPFKASPDKTRQTLIFSFCKGSSPPARNSPINLAAASPAQPRPEESPSTLGLQRFLLQTSEEEGMNLRMSPKEGDWFRKPLNSVSPPGD